MNQGILLRAPTSGWASSVFGDLLPGGHAAVFGGFRIPLEAEDAGLVVRDCLLVLGPVVHRVWLLRKPCTEATVAAQVLATGTGAMWIDGCRVYTDWNEADRPDSWKRAGFTAKPGAEKIAAPPGKGSTVILLVDGRPTCFSFTFLAVSVRGQGRSRGATTLDGVTAR